VAQAEQKLSTLRYRPAVDGLRAVAILPVIGFHLREAWVPGGFLGVDVFFVISGFLISSMISAELDRGSFRFLSFWARRVRRIMPALLTMILLTFVASLQLVTDIELGSIAEDGRAAALSYANFWMHSKIGNYWGSAAESSPFLHAWSLSVEEQFYVVYPLFLVALARLKLDRRVALGVALVLSLTLFVFVSKTDPTLAFYMLPTRAWELLLGALTASVAPQLVARTPTWVRAGASSLGLLLIGVALFTLDGRHGIGPLAALPAFGSALVLLDSGREGGLNAVLGSKPLVYVGRISYSLYLWHWAVIILAGMREMNGGPQVLVRWLLVATFVAATLSYFLVERPARVWRHGAWIALALLLAVVGLSIRFVSRAEAFQSSGAFNPVVSYSAYYDATPIIKEPVQVATINPQHPKLGAWAGVVGRLRNPKFAEAYKNGGIPGGTRSLGEPAELILIGDSHGCMWGKTVDEAASELRLGAAFFTFDGNVPFFPIPLEGRVSHGEGFTDEMFQQFARGLLQNIDDWKPRIMILAARWEDKSKADFHNAGLLADYATKAGAKVLFINNPPMLPWVNASTAARLELLSLKGVPGLAQYETARQPIKKVELANERIKKMASEVPGARVLDVYSALSKQDQVKVLNGRDVVYLDDDHLTYPGTSLFKDELKQLLSEMLR
jgi:peptidoglycan/LPS O-acetylase OafA/YrhL